MGYMDDYQKRMEALKNLKAGDKAAIRYCTAGGDSYRVVAIEKVTPTGIIKADGYQFNRDGDRRGGQSAWTSTYLVPYDAEVKAALRTRKARGLLREVIDWLNRNMRHMSTEEMECVVDAVRPVRAAHRAACEVTNDSTETEDPR